MKFLAIEGNIGAGKTSLAKKIAADTNAGLILEQFKDNNFLPKFYKNPERYSLPLELSFLINRYNQLEKDLLTFELNRGFIVSDYYYLKSLVFSSQTLQEDEFKIYNQLFNIIYDKLPKPDLLVYLNVSVERLLKNIKIRGREYEQNIKAEYLESIGESYLKLFKGQNNLKVLLVNTDNLDFVASNNDYNELKRMIFCGDYKNGVTVITK